MTLQGCSCGCETCFAGNGTCVDKISLFDSLSPEQKGLILSKSVHRTFEKGELIFSPGDPGDILYIINSGEVKIYKLSAQGRQQTLHILGPKDFIGEHALFNAQPLQNTAEALRKANICMIKGKDIRDLLLVYPDMGIKILEQYAKKNNQILGIVESIGLYDVEQRIAKYLLDLSQEFGMEAFKLPFSKGTLASIIGTSQETLSRKLSAFQEEGILGLSGQRNIAILNKDRLTEIRDGR
ncbi:Crp/Fnr family transcriptional regulator [Proteiniclasticum sp. BAD-10]|jgi:CRP/FNR family transcriptional regulator|uniref:Crp/Fnr family transcriptional regulator n=1 Tax=Proteiniclasticum sediminis TaxID=2804028 RepID=A0A941CR63_9CLOT|nr:Crp/Fnr family transcriptional regulator [Proteiniclasticum sediminis]MBR0577400.1 Crp/Fnr family transcriptional regulator [Proteiniclasticum sediminis]